MSQEATPAPAPAPEPIQYFENQPISREGAAQKRAELMVDKEFTKKALAGDREAQQKLTALWALERGRAPPETIADAEKQVADRAAREAAVHTETLLQVGLTPGMANEVTHLRPILPEEQKFHRRQLERMMRDEIFTERLRRGDAEARRDWALASIGSKALPIARNLAEIEAWEKAHPLNK